MCLYTMPGSGWVLLQLYEFRFCLSNTVIIRFWYCLWRKKEQIFQEHKLTNTPSDSCRAEVNALSFLRSPLVHKISLLQLLHCAVSISFFSEAKPNFQAFAASGLVSDVNRSVSSHMLCSRNKRPDVNHVADFISVAGRGGELRLLRTVKYAHCSSL